MEDVWKHINALPTFHPNLTPNPDSTLHHDPILRDFFTPDERDEYAPPMANRCAVNFPLVAMAASSSAYLLDSYVKNKNKNKNNNSNEKDSHLGDRKYRRMMQNRESAVRSRARRAAYTIELETEKSELMEKNAMLRRVIHLHEIFTASVAIAAAANGDKGIAKKQNLVRSLSALF